MALLDRTSPACNTLFTSTLSNPRPGAQLQAPRRAGEQGSQKVIWESQRQNTARQVNLDHAAEKFCTTNRVRVCSVPVRIFRA